jgi:hypothetical protein
MIKKTSISILKTENVYFLLRMAPVISLKKKNNITPLAYPYFCTKKCQNIIINDYLKGMAVWYGRCKNCILVVEMLFKRTSIFYIFVV